MGPRCRTLQSVKTHTDESHLGVCVGGGGGGAVTDRITSQLSI